jgi:hypothetical protein
VARGRTREYGTVFGGHAGRACRPRAAHVRIRISIGQSRATAAASRVGTSAPRPEVKLTPSRSSMPSRRSRAADRPMTTARAPNTTKTAVAQAIRGNKLPSSRSMASKGVADPAVGDGRANCRARFSGTPGTTDRRRVLLGIEWLTARQADAASRHSSQSAPPTSLPSHRGRWPSLGRLQHRAAPRLCPQRRERT